MASQQDLTAPLGLGKRTFLRLPLGLMGAGILAILCTTALVWIGIVDDPLGGEPIGVVNLDNSVDGLSARDFGVVEIDPKFNSSDVEEASDGGDAPSSLGPRYDEFANIEQGQLLQTELSFRPDSRIIENGRHGPLPITSAQGARPLDLYARPAANGLSGVPKIAIVVGGLGLSETGTEIALSRLPQEVTFAFAPYGDKLAHWMEVARKEGHELLLQLPLEPFDFPDNDPGPHTLLVDLDDAQFKERLSFLLSRMTNYVGVVNYAGGRFTASREAMQRLLQELKRRGLMYLDDKSSSRSLAEEVAKESNTPFSGASVVLDEVPKPSDIQARLLHLEAEARSKGYAVGVATALPVTIEQLERWSKDLEERGLQLTPISNTLNKTAN